MVSQVGAFYLGTKDSMMSLETESISSMIQCFHGVRTVFLGTKGDLLTEKDEEVGILFDIIGRRHMRVEGQLIHTNQHHLS